MIPPPEGAAIDERISKLADHIGLFFIKLASRKDNPLKSGLIEAGLNVQVLAVACNRTLSAITAWPDEPILQSPFTE